MVHEYESLDRYTVSICMFAFWLKSLTGVTPVLRRLVSADISDIFQF